MLQIPGPPALSAFRIAKLLDRLGALEPTVTGLAARFMHFAELAQPLSAPEREVLAQLLTYGPRLQAPAEAGAGECLLVVPRTGTISPWSSKAPASPHTRAMSVALLDQGEIVPVRGTTSRHSPAPASADASSRGP